MIAEDVRVAADHLVRERVDRRRRSRTCRARSPAARGRRSAASRSPSSSQSSASSPALDRVDDFVALLDQVRHERAVRLLAVPRARAAQPRHDLDEIVPTMVRGGRRQRDQRHRDRGRRASRAACRGRSRRRSPDASSARSSTGEPGEVRERIAEDAEAEIAPDRAWRRTARSLRRAAHEQAGCSSRSRSTSTMPSLSRNSRSSGGASTVTARPTARSDSRLPRVRRSGSPGPSPTMRITTHLPHARRGNLCCAILLLAGAAAAAVRPTEPPTGRAVVEARVAHVDLRLAAQLLEEERDLRLLLSAASAVP